MDSRTEQVVKSANEFAKTLRDTGELSYAEEVELMIEELQRLSALVAVDDQHAADPVDWPPVPGWWFVEHQVSGLLLTSFVRARIVPSRPERLGIYLDGKRRFKLDEARFLPAFIRTFPPREKPDGT